MSAFYTFLSSLYNFLLKSISLIILLGEVRKSLGEVLKFSGEVQSHPSGGAHLPAPIRSPKCPLILPSKLPQIDCDDSL